MFPTLMCNHLVGKSTDIASDALLNFKLASAHPGQGNYKTSSPIIVMLNFAEKGLMIFESRHQWAQLEFDPLQPAFLVHASPVESTLAHVIQSFPCPL